MRSNITLHLLSGAVIDGSTNPEGEIIMKNSSPVKVQLTDKLIDRYV